MFLLFQYLLLSPAVILVIGWAPNSGKQEYNIGPSDTSKRYRNESGIYIKLLANTSSVTDDPVMLCKSGDIFTDLESCQKDCSAINDVNDRVVSSHQLKNISYKIVVFNEEEYKVNSNGTLTILVNVPLQDFNQSDYFLIEKNVHVCYPLNPKLFTCLKETFTVDGETVRFLDDGRVLEIDDDLKDLLILKVSEFFSPVENKVEICKQISIFYTLRIIGYILSIIFITITLVLSLKLRELRRKNNEELLMHMAMLIIVYCCFTLRSTLTTDYLNHICPTLAFLMYFSYSSATCWLNMLSYSLYRAITTLNVITGMSFKRFLFDCIYAFGIPFIITILAAVAEFTKAPPPLFPHFTQNCWFRRKDHQTYFIFLLGPVILSLLINTMMFVLISIHLKRLSRETITVNKKACRQIFFLLIKLSIVMGVCWFIKICIAVIDGSIDSLEYLDLVEAFHGILLFLVYIVNRRILMALWDVTQTACLCSGSKQNTRFNSQTLSTITQTSEYSK